MSGRAVRSRSVTTGVPVVGSGPIGGRPVVSGRTVLTSPIGFPAAVTLADDGAEVCGRRRGLALAVLVIMPAATSAAPAAERRDR